MKLKGSSLTGAEGKSLIAEIYTGVVAKPAPKPEPAVAAAPAAAPAPEAAPAPAADSSTRSDSGTRSNSSTRSGSSTSGDQQQRLQHQQRLQNQQQRRRKQRLHPKAEPEPAAAPEPELELKLETEESKTPTDAAVESDAASTSVPQLIRLRAGNKAIYFASTISDDTTEALGYSTNAFIPGVSAGVTLAPAATLDAPDWAKHITLGFTLTPILVQPQAYSTTGDAELQFNWAIEAGYAPRA